MQAAEILGKLVGFRSVVGLPNDDAVSWIRGYLECHGIAVDVLPGPEGDRSNIFATIGPKEAHGYILSGHMDVVPATEAGWTSDPFILRAEGGRLYGRGTTDMKGFLAAGLAAVPKLAAMPLRRPLHLAFSYDEEAGCRGVPHMIARMPELCRQPLGAIIGEPSGMRAIRAHKGKAAARLTVRGALRAFFAPGSGTECDTRRSRRPDPGGRGSRPAGRRPLRACLRTALLLPPDRNGKGRSGGQHYSGQLRGRVRGTSNFRCRPGRAADAGAKDRRGVDGTRLRGGVAGTQCLSGAFT